MSKPLEELEQRLLHAEQALATLTAQVIALQTQPTTLIAPVRIVDRAGAIVAEIRRVQHDTSMRLFNTQGQVVATIGVDGTECGYLAIRDAEGMLVGYLDVEQAGARLQILDHAQDGGVVIFGGDEDGGGIAILPRGAGDGIQLWATPQGE